MTVLESLAFTLPKHYSIAARGNWAALNSHWQDEELSSSFHPLAADSIIKIIKRGCLKQRGEKYNCHSSVLGLHAGILFQMACLLFLGRFNKGGAARTCCPLSYTASQISMIAWLWLCS